MLKITVLVHVRRSQAEDIEWGKWPPSWNCHYVRKKQPRGWKRSKWLKSMQLNEDLWISSSSQWLYWRGALYHAATLICQFKMLLWALCWHKEEMASKLVLWQPQHGQTKRGRIKTTYIHTLLEDAGFTTIGELKTAVFDQSDWRGRVHVVRANARPNYLVTNYLPT